VTVLHVIACEGAILPGTTTALEISRKLGARPHALVELWQQQWGRGELTTPGLAAKCYALWASDETPPITELLVRTLVRHRTPWRPGLTRMLRDIGSRHEHAVLVSMGPDFMVTPLLGWGVHEVIAQPMGPLPLERGRFDMAHALTPRVLVEHVQRRHDGLAADTPHGVQVLAYGSGPAELPLFERLSEIAATPSQAGTIAVNAVHGVLRERAAVTYDGPDMWTAYTHGRRLLQKPHPVGARP
jgi:phosphoserine phosphatase